MKPAEVACVWWALGLVLAGACGGTDPGAGDTSDASDTDGDSGETDDETGTGDDTSEIDMVCDRWNADRQLRFEGAWNGDAETCDAGDMDLDWRDRSAVQVNLFRWLAGLAPVEHEASRNEKAQACALIMDANLMLSHAPTEDWACWTELGKMGAGSSNIAPAPSVGAVDLYMIDPGNETTLGHRRWLLSEVYGPTGFGSTDRFSCLVTGGENELGTVDWVAWPSPGIFPIGAILANPDQDYGGIDETGWHIQSNVIDVTNATVTVSLEGEPLAIQVVPLQGGSGTWYATSWIPQGWRTEAGKTYHVEVGGLAQPIAYDVSVVDCG